MSEPDYWEESPSMGRRGSAPEGGSPGAQRFGGRWKKPWRDGSGGRWQRLGSPVERRPLPQAATPLDRIAWALVSHSEYWEQLPAATHDLLCDQPAPYGAFFRWLDRLLIDQGLQPAESLLKWMRGEADDPDGPTHADADLRALAKRVMQFVDVPDNKDTVDNLLHLIRPLELQAVREELELLTQSGELSEAAEARKIELVRLSLAMKLEISQHRPISS